jgi:hypothetical protein
MEKFLIPSLLIAIVVMGLTATTEAVKQKVIEARNQVKLAANELAYGGIRTQRKAAICKALRMSEVRKWTGRVQCLRTSIFGSITTY